ncbi:Bug family tripartite tricarboxylate transporter substrate binding protein [Cupriavidus basilensis]|uniref:Bug family tripartite tricarboxylate transporter substrate binding protein n=1 Tax=Cupriavidus basilensis TaxID=68895 RepID=UPI00283C10B9|nr:tripartite tricarboxylate transporter substrate binding protein [Cupriavidus basilensis]MDR3384684.1 tripartite tricarboxylate transporter substrate binding protein [Cupriavidus basilensis]
MKRQALALLATAATLAAAVLPLNASAQAGWPSKPITYVVPFPPGGTTDTLARLIGQRLGQALGTTVVVENRPGAGGNIGSDYASKAAPDGYTILGGTISSHAINASLYPKMPYDVVKSFAPITLIGTNANVLVVSAGSPFKTVKDIVAEAKAKPDTLAFASAGNGTSQHLAGELFKSLAGIKITHIPYKGSGPAIQDVMAGQVPMMFDTTVVAAQHIDSGKLRALAVTSARRIKSMPNVPTMAEAGVSGYELESWQAIFAPANTPKPIVDRLYKEISAIIKTPDMQARLEKLGMEPSGMSPVEFAEFQRSEIVKWAKVVKAADIRID